jgi:hypothetical protein
LVSAERATALQQQRYPFERRALFRSDGVSLGRGVKH